MGRNYKGIQAVGGNEPDMSIFTGPDPANMTQSQFERMSRLD